jgi:hypothetical protein
MVRDDAETLTVGLSQSARRVAVSRFPSRADDDLRLVGIPGDRESSTQFTEGGVTSSPARERTSQLFARAPIRGIEPQSLVDADPACPSEQLGVAS